MWFVKFGIAILLLLVFVQTINAQTVVPPTFFGITFNNSVDYPSVPFGSMRLWDTGTTWAEVEPSNGVYSWAWLDHWLAVAAANDKDVILTFANVPTWASSNPTAFCSGCQYPPVDLDSGDAMWKAFITALVNHSLSSPSKHIAYYELWNEPDLLARWSGTPAQLVTMAADAYAIIHALDPTAKVIGPSPSTANKHGVHFLPAYYAAGGAPYQDIVGLHGYVYVVDGNTFATTPENIAVSISELKSLMTAYDISSKPIFFTEGSYGNISMTDAQKVAYVAREYLLMWTGGVSRYYWYSWDNTSFGTMWSAATGVQPVGIAYAQASNWMSGAIVSPCVSTGTVYTCALTRDPKYKALVVWDTEGSSTYDMPISFTGYRDLAGNSHPLSGPSVTIGAEPIILETNSGMPISSNFTATISPNPVDQLRAFTVTGSIPGVAGFPAPTGVFNINADGTNPAYHAMVQIGTGPISLTVPANLFAAGTSQIGLSYSGDTNYAASELTLPVTVTAPFTVSTSSVTVSRPGATKNNGATVMISPMGGFVGTVNLTCTLSTVSVPPGAIFAPTCSIPSSTRVAGTSPVSVVMTVLSTPSSSTTAPGPLRMVLPTSWALASLTTMLLLVVGFGHKLAIRRPIFDLRAAIFLFLLMSIFGLAACASSGPGGADQHSSTTAGTYTFVVGATVRGTDGTTLFSTTADVMATVE